MNNTTGYLQSGGVWLAEGIDLFGTFSESPLETYFRNRTATEKGKKWKQRIRSYVQPTNRRKIKRKFDLTCDEDVLYSIIGLQRKSSRRRYRIKRTLDGVKHSFYIYWHKIEKGELESLIPWTVFSVDRRDKKTPLRIDMKWVKIGYVKEFTEVHFWFAFDIVNITYPGVDIPYMC